MYASIRVNNAAAVREVRTSIFLFSRFYTVLLEWNIVIKHQPQKKVTAIPLQYLCWTIMVLYCCSPGLLLLYVVQTTNLQLKYSVYQVFQQ